MSNEKIYNDGDIKLNAGQYRYAIVAARFNAFIVDKLLSGAIDTLKAAGAEDSQITVLRVPGAFEIPFTCQRLAESAKHDAIISLGCVIRGDTPHFDYVCNEVARGTQDVMLKSNLPIIFGILTTDNTEQAEARIAPNNNKGADAAKAAMEMLALTESI